MRVIVNDDPTHTMDAQSSLFRDLGSHERIVECAHDRTSSPCDVDRPHKQACVSRPPLANRARIEVISSGRESRTREPGSSPVPRAYISQAELVVLGQLLPDFSADTGSKSSTESGPDTMEFLDYAFDQRDEKLPQRRETWTRVRAKRLSLGNPFGGAPAKLVQEFDAKGVRVRRTDLDGTVTERIDLEDLRRLWNEKGLPVRNRTSIPSRDISVRRVMRSPSRLHSVAAHISMVINGTHDVIASPSCSAGPVMPTDRSLRADDRVRSIGSRTLFAGLLDHEGKDDRQFGRR
jgi:hypothetical protein